MQLCETITTHFTVFTGLSNFATRDVHFYVNYLPCPVNVNLLYILSVHLIFYFGILRDITGCTSVSVSTPTIRGNFG